MASLFSLSISLALLNRRCFFEDSCCSNEILCMHAVWSTVRIQNISFRHDISWQFGVRKCFVPILTNVFGDNAFFAIQSIDFLTHPKDVSHSIRIDDRCTVMSTIDNNDKNENDHRHIELSFSQRTNAAAASLLSVRKHTRTHSKRGDSETFSFYFEV